jgi:hypothetical protein
VPSNFQIAIKSVNACSHIPPNGSWHGFRLSNGTIVKKIYLKN